MLLTKQYAGYIIYVPFMKPWFAWLRWLNPVFYAFEALIIGELSNLELQCVAPQLAPYGPGYGTSSRGCAIAGASPGSTVISGTIYAETAFGFYLSHVWRNYGIILALGILCLALCIIQTERLPAAGSNRAVLLYKRGGGGKFIRAANQNGTAPRDEEEGQGYAQVGEKPGQNAKATRTVSTASEVHVASTET